jgi:hypothetical protein
LGALWILAGAVAIGALVGTLVVLVRRTTPQGRREADAHDRQRGELRVYEDAGMRVWPSARLRISGEHAGTSFECKSVPGSDGVCFEVSIATDRPGEFHVGPEGTRDSLAKQLGMVDEYQTGDRSLDWRYFFSGTTGEYVREVFRTQTNLDLARALLNGRCKRLDKTPQRLRAALKGPRPPGVQEIHDTVAMLGRFQLPATAPGGAGGLLGGRRALWAIRWSMAALFVGGLALVWLCRPLVDGWFAFAARTSPLNLFFYAVLLAGAYFLLKGRSMAARGLIEMIFAFPLLAGPLVGVLAFVNERADRVEAREHEVRVLKRWVTYGGRSNSPRFHVRFESWRGHASEEFSGLHLDAAAEGEAWIFRIRPGALGHAWIEHMGRR